MVIEVISIDDIESLPERGTDANWIVFDFENGTFAPSEYDVLVFMWGHGATKYIAKDGKQRIVKRWKRLLGLPKIKEALARSNKIYIATKDGTHTLFTKAFASLLNKIEQA